MKSMFKNVNPRLKGVALLICIVGVFAVLYYCLHVILASEITGGSGHYYEEPMRTPLFAPIEDTFSIIGLLLLFYPLLKLSFSLIFSVSRDDYYGLFVARSKGSRILSRFFTGLNIINIVFLLCLCIKDVYRIIGYVCTTEWDLCPAYDEEFFALVVLMILFWGIVHFVYGICHRLIEEGERIKDKHR